MEKNIMNQIMYHFSQEGLIFFCKTNEYYKIKSLKFDEILCIKNALESNQQFQKLDNRICYISCCLYLLTKYDGKYISEFCKKIITNLSFENNPINDTYLYLIYNCIDYDENFLHSNKKKLYYLLNYLGRFSSFKKTKENYLLYKYYHDLLMFRLGNAEEALKKSHGIIASIEEEKNKMTKYIEFIKLKTNLLQIKINEANNNLNQLRENHNLLKNVYEKVKNENPFLALKLGLIIYDNLYNNNLFNNCVQILDEMHQILKNYERNGVSPKKTLRFSLSVFCRYGAIGLLLANKQYIDLATNEMKNGLLLITNDLNYKKTMYLFKAYNFALNILKINCNIYVESPKEISNSFMKEFVSNKFQEGKYLSDNFLIDNTNINQCIINLNSINTNLDISIHDQASKIIDYYTQKLINPEKNIISHDEVFTFIIGLHDRIRYISEKYLTDNNKNNKEQYKNQIISNSNIFFSYIDKYSDCEPLLKTEFFKSIIIKIFSCGTHVYFYNKEYNKVLNSIKYFENLCKKLNINSKTPSYELFLKVRGDYFFKQQNFYSAISNYLNSAKTMNDNNPKKPVVYFNLGVSYYHVGNKNSSIENMKNAAELFKKIADEKSTFEFHKRDNNLINKYNLTQYYIKEIQNNL